MSVQGECYQIGGEESEMSSSAGDLPHLPTSLSLSFFFWVPLQWRCVIKCKLNTLHVFLCVNGDYWVLRSTCMDTTFSDHAMWHGEKRSTGDPHGQYAENLLMIEVDLHPFQHIRKLHICTLSCLQPTWGWSDFQNRTAVLHTMLCLRIASWTILFVTIVLMKKLSVCILVTRTHIFWNVAKCFLRNQKGTN